MWVEVLGALYGLWESNRLFSDEVVAVCTAAGFCQSPLSPMTMVQCLPTSSDIKCIVSIHVDDFRILSNSALLVAKLSTALKTRFADITGNASSTMFAGVSCTQHTNGALSFSQRSYILRVAKLMGFSHVQYTNPLMLICFHRQLVLMLSPSRLQRTNA